MPYRYAHWWVLACMAVILIGFWSTYWSIVGTSRWEHHLHGLVSTIWVLMVFAQSWTIYHKKIALHRLTGQASMFLFPLLMAGLFAVQAVNAQVYVAGGHPIVSDYGPAFLFGLAVAAAAYVTLYYRALKYRRKVWVHSAYLLGTPMILFESPAGRMFNSWLPPLTITGPQEFWKIMPAILFSDALMVLLALVLWQRARAKSHAFAVIAGFIVAQMVVMAALFYGGGGEGAVHAVATVSTPNMVASGFVIGAATSWLGWQAGKRPAKKPTMPSVGSATI